MHKLYYLTTFLLAVVGPLAAQGPSTHLLAQKAGVARTVTVACPLDQLLIIGAKGQTVEVTDGKGQVYFSAAAGAETPFVVGGALGRHTISTKDKKGQKKQICQFEVGAKTQIADNTGYYTEMFEMFHTSMNPSKEDGSSVSWNGKTYRYFVPWMLDHCHNMKGQKYFLGYGAEFVDLMRANQREDGMIYSFVQYMKNADYFLTRDKFSGYSQRIGDRVFVRQPTENHPEYIYVNTIYQCWKSAGDDAWMQQTLPSAMKALDYTLHDPARWSKRFQLLKRVYTIDSWDFAVEDEYLPNIGLTNSMIIDPEKSKFGVFFGDNTGYIAACFELAEMLERAGQKTAARQYRERGQEIKERLDKLAWNGRFYTHFIDEDPTVKRNLGVDERSQIAQSNAYSLNRPLLPAQSKAIVETYLDLKNHLPLGSPGEWYAIYPPFQRGFGTHNDIWQYMNGGVGGHVAGELSRGAFECGYEQYATDILQRLFELGKKYDHKIYFAYTGSIPPPSNPPRFTPLYLAPYANMDSWSQGGGDVAPWMQNKGSGDDLRALPTGVQTFANIPFNLTDPAKNGRKAVVAVSKQSGFPATVEIPVNDTAACVYMLHTASKPVSENIAGAVSFVYADGSTKFQYMVTEKHLTYWWFSELNTERSGIAWYGKNAVSEGIGLSWCALDNPEPRKKISKIILHAPEEKGFYTVLGITLSDKPHTVPIKGPSYGGPDNWAAATAMAALLEGLAGVKDASGTTAYTHPLLSPRWNTTRTDTLCATVCYPASNSYVSYKYIQNTALNTLELLLTGSGEQFSCHLLLPASVQKPRSLLVDGRAKPFTIAKTEASMYVDFSLEGAGVRKVVLTY